MYAIVEIAGQQYKVRENQKIFVNRLPEKAEEIINLERVLMIDNNNKIKIGTPIIPDAVVRAKILSHLKGDKVLVFKKKRRKGYKKLRGHRQYLSLIQILSINEKLTTAEKHEGISAEQAPITEEPLEISASEKEEVLEKEEEKDETIKKKET